MAKLPDIVQGERAALRVYDNYGAVVAAANQNMGLVNQAIEGAGKVAEEHREYALNGVNSEYQDVMSEFRIRAGGLKYATVADIEEMGLDDVIDTNGRDAIPKSEWYPIALERKMNEARRVYGEKIVSPIDRQRWLDETAANDRKVLEAESIRAVEESHAHMEELKRVDTVDAMRAGRWQTARDKASSIRDPSIRQKALSEINVAEVNHQEALFIESASPADLKAMADEYRTEEFIASDPRSSDELISAANRLDRIADERINEAKLSDAKIRSAYQTNALRGIYDASERGALTYEMIVAAESNPLADESFVKSLRGVWKNYKDNLASGPWANTSDPGVLSKLRGNIANPEFDKGQARRELNAAIPYLTESKWNELDKSLQASVDPVKAVGVRTTEQMIQGRLLGMGIDTGRDASKEDVIQGEFYRSIVDSALMNAQAAKGDKPLTDVERTSIINRSMYQAERQAPGRLWGTNTYGSVIELISEREGEDNALKKVNDISSRIRARGGEVTPDLIYKFYKADKGW